FFFQAEDGIRDFHVTGVQTCALPILQVAPSDPNIVYAGTGDSVGGSLGDGMYKSVDAGKTWTHIGLEDTVKINKIVIDPKDPNRSEERRVGKECRDRRWGEE